MLIGLTVPIDHVADEGEAHRVQLVQHGRRAVGPTIARQRTEMRRLAIVDAGSLACLGHVASLTGRRGTARGKPPSMARIVMKFGGTSMAGTERIRRVANGEAQAEAGDEVAVVVSAMAGETDRLVNFCREADALYDPPEYDVVVASRRAGYQGLLAITLQGWALTREAGLAGSCVRASGACQGADRGDRYRDAREAFERRRIAVIPGFQGVTRDGR